MVLTSFTALLLLSLNTTILLCFFLENILLPCWASLLPELVLFVQVHAQCFPATYNCQEHVPTSYNCREHVPATYNSREPILACYNCREQVPASYNCREYVPAYGKKYGFCKHFSIFCDHFSIF